jgi:hypothetical protein
MAAKRKRSIAFQVRLTKEEHASILAIARFYGGDTASQAVRLLVFHEKKRIEKTNPGWFQRSRRGASDAS